MAISAYILITAINKEVGNVLTTLEASKVVSSANAVTGPFDIIGTVEAEDVDALGRLITNEIQNIHGIERTLTCIVLNV